LSHLAHKVHFEALGYEPMRMKPVHFATNFFLSVMGQYYTLEWLNKASVIKVSPNGSDQYVSENLYPILREGKSVGDNISLAQFKLLRNHLNALLNNDGSTLQAVFSPYKNKSFGNDHSFSSDKFIVNTTRNHGYAGEFVHKILASTKTGNEIIESCKRLLTDSQSPMEKLTMPLLDEPCDVLGWQSTYDEKMGILTMERISYIAKMMEPQTRALRQLTLNVSADSSGRGLRYIVIGLCSWLFIYTQRMAEKGTMPLMFMDFLREKNSRVRDQSCLSYARQREKVCTSYDSMVEDGIITYTEPIDNKIKKSLEQHFSDLALRIGFVQPRAFSVRQKHFELHPDSLKVLMFSILHNGEIVTLDVAAKRLFDTWGICMGCLDQDYRILRSQGYSNLDEDEDLEPNCKEFKDLLIRINLASEPSDGLTLCSLNSEDLI